MVIIKALLILLTSNIIFSKALGTGGMYIASKDKTNLINLSIVITFFTVLGSAGVYLADRLIFDKEKGTVLLFKPFCYIFIISIIYIVSLIILKLINSDFFNRIKKYIHISAFNCVVLGTLLINSGQANLYNYNNNYLFKDYILFGLKSGLGFLAAAYMLKIAHIKLDSDEVPDSFSGYPILLIYVGILSMSLYSIGIV